MISADLGQQLEAFVAKLVESGRYRSKSEAQLAALDAMMERAIAQSDAGEGKPAAEVFDRLEAKYRAMAGLAGK